MKKFKAVELFQSAGIEVLKVWEIPNLYWPAVCEEERKAHPWWLVKTRRGLIEIGWCKHDIKINWVDTGLHIDVPDRAIAKGEFWVHATSNEEAVFYLTLLAEAIGHDEPRPLEKIHLGHLENHPKFDEFIRSFWREINKFEDELPHELPNPLPLEIRATLARTIHLLED